LAKRRWRGIAEDGTEFGFDLESPLRNGSFFFNSSSSAYYIKQQPEAVIEIVCPSDPSAAARIGWMLGNLHFPIEIIEGRVRVCDDSAIRQMLVREGFSHYSTEAIFQPLSGAHSHGI
jgi:urease accessory protein